MDYSDDIEDPGWVPFSGGMQPGAGYTSRNGQLATFSGPVNDGTINYPIVSYPFIMGNTDPGTPFNLVGNPYPGAISAAALVAANNNIAGSIYFWDDDLTSGLDTATQIMQRGMVLVLLEQAVALLLLTETLPLAKVLKYSYRKW